VGHVYLPKEQEEKIQMKTTLKTTLTIVSMCVMLVLSIAAVATAQEGPPGQVCAANGDFGLSHDTCVNCIAAINQGERKGSIAPGVAANCICKQLEDLGGGPEFKNHGECVNFIKGLL